MLRACTLVVEPGWRSQALTTQFVGLELQEQLDRLKVEAGKTGEQLQEAKAKLDAAEKDLNAARQSAYEDSQIANKEKQEMHTTITNLQVGIHRPPCSSMGPDIMLILGYQAARNVLLFCTAATPCSQPVVRLLNCSCSCCCHSKQQQCTETLLLSPSLLSLT